MNISRALEIPGWMLAVELEWLATEAAKHLLIVEIGSYEGRSTRALADNTEGVVIAIDNWYGPTGVGNSKPLPPSSTNMGSSGQQWSDEDRQQLYGKFCWNLEDHLAARKVQAVKADHKTVNLDVCPDMVFIDGDHSYESVANDIKIWLPKLQPGGLMSGHDGNQEEVIRAAREFSPACKILERGTIWYFTK